MLGILIQCGDHTDSDEKSERHHVVRCIPTKKVGMPLPPFALALSERLALAPAVRRICFIYPHSMIKPYLSNSRMTSDAENLAPLSLLMSGSMVKFVAPIRLAFSKLV